MDCEQSEGLTRADITSILNRRHLKIPNIESLPYEELLRIYNTFAVPLEKRTNRPKRVVLPEYPIHPAQPNMYRPIGEDLFAQTIVINGHMHYHSRQYEHILQETKVLKLALNSLPHMAKKRNSFTMNGVPDVTPPKLHKPVV